MPAPSLTAALMVACRYPSDDINKFLWMVRIGGGVFPDIKEADYLGPRGYTIDDSAGKVTSRSHLLPGWDWGGKVFTSSVLQHGRGLEACTEEVPGDFIIGKVSLLSACWARHRCTSMCYRWGVMDCWQRAVQLCHAVRQRYGWPGAVLQQPNPCTMSCGIIKDCTGKTCWL